MCTICGCGNEEPAGHNPDSAHHAHDHSHEHHEHPMLEGTHVPGLHPEQIIRIERDILAKNDAYAQQNRQWFEDHNVLAFNLLSSPGAGKTSLLLHTIAAIDQKTPISVIEGDQQTDRDAEKIRASGTNAIQINTGKGCHLDAHQVGHALQQLAPPANSLLFIENVGNLVCPAAFDLGEAYKIVILSVTEGDDKPLKYPDMFAAARLMLITKTDLLPYVDFDIRQATEYAKRINPQIEVLALSIKTNQDLDAGRILVDGLDVGDGSSEGFGAWLAWIEHAGAQWRQHNTETIAALRQRIASLEAALAAKT